MPNWEDSHAVPGYTVESGLVFLLNSWKCWQGIWGLGQLYCFHRLDSDKPWMDGWMDAYTVRLSIRCTSDVYR